MTSMTIKHLLTSTPHRQALTGPWAMLCRMAAVVFIGIVIFAPPFLDLSPMCYAQGPATKEVLPQQRMGANDLVAVDVYNSAELSLRARIGEDGGIELPMLKRKITATGLLPSELAKTIGDAYVQEGILVNPVVTVSVLEYASKPVSVIGAVNKPTTFYAEQPITLLEAVTRASGFSDDAGSYLLLSTVAESEDGDQPVLTERIAIADILESAGTTAGIRLYGGEEIRVPEAGKIYIVGNVKKPGTYRIPNDHKTTVLKALALSEGLLPNATKEAYIYRRTPDGSKAEIPINLRQLMARRSEDVTLLRDDVLYVPESTGKKAAMSAVDRAIAFGSATLSGVLIWGVAR
jgi:polysaccharide export outer membrane protein